MLRIAPTADCLWAGGSGASLVHDRFSPQRLTRSSVGTVNLDLKQIPEGIEPPWFSAWGQKHLTIQHDRSAPSMDTSVDKGPCKQRSPFPAGPTDFVQFRSSGSLSRRTAAPWKVLLTKSPSDESGTSAT